MKDLLDHGDPAVVYNCIEVLNELNADNGGMEGELSKGFPSLRLGNGTHTTITATVTRDIMLKLLNRLSTFNEFGLASVLNLLCRYTPADKNET